MEDKSRLMYFFAWSFRQMKNYKLGFLLILVLGFITIAINLAVVRLIEIAVSNVSDGYGSVFNIVTIRLFIVLLAGLFVNVISDYMNGWLGARVSYSIKGLFNHKILTLSKSSKDQISSGDIVSRLNYDIDKICNFIPEGLSGFLFQIIMAISAAIYLGCINWFLLLVSLGFLPVNMFIINFLQKKMRKYFKLDSEIRSKSSETIKETINNIQAVKVYAMQNVISEKIDGFYKQCMELGIKIHKIFSPTLMLTIMMQHLPRLLCVCAGGFLALNGRLQLEALVGFIMLLDYIVKPITSLPNMISSILAASVSFQRLGNTMDLPDERTDGSDVPRPINAPICLEAKNISFGYDEDTEILHNISFQLKQGEKIALVGKSGCGKSSILKLICGDYAVTSGELKLYGKPYHELSLQSIREQISLVSQDIVLFPMSIRDNIAIGSADVNISDQAIEEAAKSAGAHQFIMSLPDKYDTKLLENSINLSGGQKQMLAIARAFLKPSPIILLDEPTSAIDAQCQAIIAESLSRLVQNKGVIIVSHQLSAIIDSDRILLIKDGWLIGDGTHKFLFSNNDIYKKLYQYGFEIDNEAVYE